MVFILILLYLVIGYGVIWFVGKVYKDNFPDIWEAAEKNNDDIAEEFEESSKSELEGLFKYFGLIIIPGLIAWPILLIMVIINSIRSMMK